MKQFLRVLMVVPLYALTLQAQAALINFSADLSPANEVPAVTNSNGNGFGAFLLDTDTNAFSWLIAFGNLSAPAVAAHIHSQAAGTLPGAENGGVVINLDSDPGAIFSMLGAPFGGFFGSTVISGTQAMDLQNNLWYVNIHTPNNIGGEVRGQITVPEPATVSLMLLGAAGLVGLRRRKNQHR